MFAAKCASQIQLTRPYSTVRSVLTIEDLRENLSAQSGIFLAHTAYSCVICFPNLENASDTEFQTPPDSPTSNSPPPNAMDIDMITSTPVRQPTERAAHNLAPPGSPITIMPPPMEVDIISGTGHQ